MTARFALERQPASYIGIERDEVAAQQVRRYLSALNRQCLVGVAEETGLPDRSATVVYGEAMLTMQAPDKKIRIVREAARLLTPGGRYGIHELCLQPDDVPDSKKEVISRALSETIRIGARPLTVAEWKALLEAEGFTIASQVTTPMHLLEPKRLIQDEGFGGFMRFVWNAVRNPVARRRILGMRAIFRSYAESLRAVTMVGVRQGAVDAEHPQNPQ